MMKQHIAIVSIFFTIISFLFVLRSFAFFTDRATSSGNTFTAAAVFPSPIPTVTPTASPTPTPTEAPLQTVVINELMWMGSSASSDDEWIELRNMTDNDIDLSGWKLFGARVGDAVLTIGSGTISANGFFLISNFSDADSNSILDVSPDLVTTQLQLDNSDLQVILRDNIGTLIDVVDDASGLPLAGSSVAPRKSMERKDPPGDGTLAANWHTSTGQVNLDEGASEFATPRAENSSVL